MEPVKLFMALLGGKPKGRRIEQHDVFFGIASSMKDLVPDIKTSWPGAKQNLHVDAWREVTTVDGWAVQITGREDKATAAESRDAHLFFLNLGGYREAAFEEFHYRMLLVAPTLDVARRRAKDEAFMQQHNAAGNTHRQATAHIDDRYGIDVDDAFAVQDILPAHHRDQFRLLLHEAPDKAPDALHLGYFRLTDLG